MHSTCCSVSVYFVNIINKKLSSLYYLRAIACHKKAKSLYFFVIFWFLADLEIFYCRN